MKVESYGDSIYLYIHREQMESIGVDNLEQLEDYFRKIFGQLKSYYHITIAGFYDIDIYIDKFYGSVIEMKKEPIDYYDMYENEVDMKITIHNTEFLYKLEDSFSIEKFLLKKMKYKLFRNTLYGKLEEDISTIEFAKLLENSEIVYHTEEILNYGKELTL